MESIKCRGRNLYLDVAKAIALLFVISGHIGMGGQLTVWVYSFHLPIFFIISGYLFELKSDFKTFFYKKIRGLIIPYISFSIVIVSFDCFYYGVFQGEFKHTLIMLIGLIIQRRCTTLWFLTALFIGIIVFWIVVKIAKKDFLIMIFSAVLSIAFILYDLIIKSPLPWNIDTAFIVQIYFAVGYVLKKKGILEKIFVYKKRFQLTIAVLLSVFSTYLTYINYALCGQYFEMFEGDYGILPLTIVASIVLSFALIIVSHFLTKFKWLLYLGKNTIVYFAVHLSIAIPLASLITKYLKIITENSIIDFFVMLIIVLLICGVLDCLISCTGIYWLFGKKEKINISKTMSSLFRGKKL